MLLLAGAACVGASTASSPTLQPDSTPPLARDPAEEQTDLEIVSVAPRDFIPAILDPEFLPVEEVPPWFRDEETVIGVTINGDVRAYPIAILSQHEVANDVVGGMPILITW